VKARSAALNHQDSKPPISKPSAISPPPSQPRRRGERSIYGCRLRLGFATVTAPIIRAPSVFDTSKIGAATYITEELSSPTISGVERAPYWPRRVRYTSFQRE